MSAKEPKKTQLEGHALQRLRRMEGALASDESTQPRPLPLFLSRCQDRSGLTAGPEVGDSAAENPEGLPEFYFILKLVNVRVNSGLSGSLFVPEKNGNRAGGT